MLNLLALEFALEPRSAMFWIIVVLGALLIVEMAVFAILLMHKHKNHEYHEEKPRRTIGITLNTEVVRREYKVGEKFDPSGLIVTARYSDDPLEETLHEFTVVTPELIKKLANDGKKPEDLLGCRIYAPDLSVAGKPMVTVAFQDQVAAYAITVSESASVEPEVKIIESKAAVEVVEEPIELVNYEITIVAPEELQILQVALFNGLDQVGDAVNVEDRKAIIAAPAGDYYVRVFCLPTDDYVASVEPLSAEKRETTVTITYIDDAEVYEEEEVVEEAVEEEPVVEEVVPVVSEIVEVVEEPAVEETVTEEPAPVEEIAVADETAPLIIEEESFEGGILRYDRSFTARLIQAENEIKGWYTDIKNELLSYKKVKDRMSWKRESYNCGRQAFAKLAFRGETLCLYLPLDPASFAESKYKVEDASENNTYKDTPCLYRIKNNRRAKYAAELIAMVAENMEIPKIERESQDYYVPYEGLVELINKGLVKRSIKDKSSEVFFVEKKDSDENV